MKTLYSSLCAFYPSPSLMLLKYSSSPCPPELSRSFICSSIYSIESDKLLSFATCTVVIPGDAILNTALDFSPQLSLKFPDGQWGQYYGDQIPGYYVILCQVPRWGEEQSDIGTSKREM